MFDAILHIIFGLFACKLLLWGLDTVMQSVYVINCIEVLVITSIVGECWRFNWNIYICQFAFLSTRWPSLASFVVYITLCLDVTLDSARCSSLITLRVPVVVSCVCAGV